MRIRCVNVRIFKSVAIGAYSNSPQCITTIDFYRARFIGKTTHYTPCCPEKIACRSTQAVVAPYPAQDKFRFSEMLDLYPKSYPKIRRAIWVIVDCILPMQTNNTATLSLFFKLISGRYEFWNYYFTVWVTSATESFGLLLEKYGLDHPEVSTQRYLLYNSSNSKPGYKGRVPC